MVLKIIHEFDPKFVESQESAVFDSLKLYVRQLADNTLNSHFDVIEKIVSSDEDFTYELLTTQKIMTVLANQ